MTNLHLIELGCPLYLVERIGCVLFWDCLWNLKMPLPKEKDILRQGDLPEYWGGYCFTRYQWPSGHIPFANIFDSIPISKIIGDFDFYHIFPL